MSSVTIGTLPRMSREVLSTLILSASSIAVVDVRDSDHVGGHIKTSHWVPSSTLSASMSELVSKLMDKEKVVFHCALSQQRGPAAALRYLRERAKMFGEDSAIFAAQDVYVLDGGFTKWQEAFGKDERLTEAYNEAIWSDGFY